jgi:hypothetical protein
LALGAAALSFRHVAGALSAIGRLCYNAADAAIKNNAF